MENATRVPPTWRTFLNGDFNSPLLRIDIPVGDSETVRLLQDQAGTHKTPVLEDGQLWRMLFLADGDDPLGGKAAIVGGSDRKAVMHFAPFSPDGRAAEGLGVDPNSPIPVLPADGIEAFAAMAAVEGTYRVTPGAWQTHVPVIHQALLDLARRREVRETPPVFLANGKLTTLNSNGEFVTLSFKTLGALLGEAGRWVYPSRGRKPILELTAPHQNALGAVVENPDVDLPHLDSIVRSPVVLPGPVLLSGPGYLEEFAVLSTIDDLPTMTLGEAKKVLKDAFGEFMFADEQAEANAMAALFTVPLRYADPTMTAPMFAFTKADRNTGASALMQCVSIITRGKKMQSVGWVSDTQEMEKRVGAKFLTGTNAVFFDNVLEMAECSLMSTLITEGRRRPGYWANLASSRTKARSPCSCRPTPLCWPTTIRHGFAKSNSNGRVPGRRTRTSVGSFLISLSIVGS